MTPRAVAAALRKLAGMLARLLPSSGAGERLGRCPGCLGDVHADELCTRDADGIVWHTVPCWELLAPRNAPRRKPGGGWVSS